MEHRHPSYLTYDSQHENLPDPTSTITRDNRHYSEVLLPSNSTPFPISPNSSVKHVAKDTITANSTDGMVSSSSSMDALPSAVVSTSARSASVLRPIQKTHQRRSSSIPGWDSDDDNEPDRTAVNRYPVGPSQPSQPMSEKSPWLQKEHKKQKQVRTCLCLGVILCFLVLGAILAFVFKEQVFHKDTDSSLSPAHHPRKGGPGTGAGGKRPRQQLHDSIESIYHVNKTIHRDPDLINAFYGIDYTPRGSQEPDCKANLGNVIEDIKVLSQLTNRIRLYGMACRQAEYVLKAIEYLGLPDMQVILTLWVDNNKASWDKQARIFWNLIDNDLLMDASNSDENVQESTFKSQGIIRISQVASRIIGVSVGNEVLFRNEDESKKKDHVPLSVLSAYMNEIRQGLAERAAAASASSDPALNNRGRRLGQIPIFSSDLGRNAHQIVDQVDWVLSNIHPFFAYTDVNSAADWALTNFRNETLKAAAGKPAMVSEVGWPSGPSSAKLGSAVPSMENLQIFVDTWVCRANRQNIPYYFFEAFDEPWKNSIHPRESQWGIMTVDRHLKVKIPTC
ncbi:hypothetical protein BG005_007605 [Podila minutissima]|nr:hypothetical protein BG005_007605 [Podila minutissima]